MTDADDGQEKRFEDPKLAINRVYTRRGDRGQTSLVSGQRVEKDALRVEAYGTVDELNSQLGLAVVTARALLDERPRLAELDGLVTIIVRVQHELFNLGSLLATLPDQVHEKQPRVTGAEIARLEAEIDRMNDALPELRSFVLPGGSRLSVELHVARTVCRRAERICVRLAREQPDSDPHAVGYLNRLSDALFVWSRWADVIQGAAETLWDPNVGTPSATD